MSESLPITTPPRRRSNLLAQVQSVFNASSLPPNTDASSKSSSVNITRKLESYHHALLESGCQSAKSSPLPHRRLDKLEGVIRDKPVGAAITSIRRNHESDDNSSSCESSPAFLRKAAAVLNPAIEHHRFISNHQESPMPYRKQTQPNDLQMYNTMSRKKSDGHFLSISNKLENGSDNLGTPIMRRRVESDCSCTRKPVYEQSNIDCVCSPQVRRKLVVNRIASPTKSVLGEPGCFSSPIHQRSHEPMNNFSLNSGISLAMNSPAKSVLGEPGVFASPARSVNLSAFAKNDDLDNADVPTIQADQTVVSGWLKFRDNKRVSRIASFFSFFSVSA